MRQGTILRVPTLEAEPGSRVHISDVLLVSDGDRTQVGTPTVEGAAVVAEVLEHGRGKKVINFKYKAKVRYRRKRGHRQGYTALQVKEILTGGATPSVAETSSVRTEAQSAEAAAEAPAAEAPATPRRRARVPAATGDAPPEPGPRRRRTPAADSPEGAPRE